MPEIQELRLEHRYLFHSNSSTLLPSDSFRATIIKKERNRIYLSDIHILSDTPYEYQYPNWTVHTQFLKKVEALEEIIQPSNTKLPNEIIRLIDTFL
jgi:hypothetical protein